jgi:hypothetical protein
MGTIQETEQYRGYTIQKNLAEDGSLIHNFKGAAPDHFVVLHSEEQPALPGKVLLTTVARARQVIDLWHNVKHDANRFMRDIRGLSAPEEENARALAAFKLMEEQGKKKRKW